MIPSLLVLASAVIPFTLGALHLGMTFSGPNLRPRDPELEARMREVSPGITRQTTIWRSWIGFNASHSSGALLFGVVYGYLALVHPAVLFHSVVLAVLGALFLLGYVVLGHLYWFSAPLRGFLVAFACYLAGFVVAWV